MKITPKKILQFLEGNLKMFGEKIYLLSDHEKEQVAYRAMLCKDECVELGYCKYCGCDLPGKFYVRESCNSGEIFPDLMKKEDWEKYKLENNIKT
jgi:hypothetical protein